jgi:thiol-disulfide isomerase/thioredoxin
VVFLNFWATWCVPCVAELPGIQRLYDKLRDERVAFVCVSPEAGPTVNSFIQEKGFTVPVFTLSGDPPPVFKVEGYPSTFIVAPDGRIAFNLTGTAIWDDDSSVRFIKRLLQ